MLASPSGTDRAGTILYALGWTQHSIGSQIIRTGAMMQLLLGNIGIPGGGLNALRGHSNIQRLTDLGLMSNLLPGYLTLPSDREQVYEYYISQRTQTIGRAYVCTPVTNADFVYIFHLVKKTV